MSQRTPIIDCHVHALPPALLEQIAARPVHGWSAERVDAGWRVSVPGDAAPKLVRPPMVDAPRRAAWAEGQGLTTQIVSPWLDAQPTAAMPAAAARDWAARLNGALLEQETAAGNAVLATLACADPGRAADDLRQAVADGFAGVVLSTADADTRLEPVWAAAAESRTPILLHPPSDGPSRAIEDSEEFGNTYGRLVDSTYAVTRLLLSGVLDRHPGLRLILVHGGGFLPYQARRLDGGHRADKLAGHRIARDRPSDYLGDLHFDTVAMAPEAIAFLASVAGADRVLLGSDHPFPLGDPDPVGTVRSAGLGEEATAAVLGGNAAGVFALPAGRAEPQSAEAGHA
ncbi:amidohydrolase family protein [Actinoplanes sp. NPDC051411]|uniref:amidohydrolase family protein n=1 Tax=Actinoplanes sp. NPDC051411 TaxID=3155522 RepID=UPI003439620B